MYRCSTCERHQAPLRFLSADEWTYGSRDRQPEEPCLILAFTFYSAVFKSFNRLNQSGACKTLCADSVMIVLYIPLTRQSLCTFRRSAPR